MQPFDGMVDPDPSFEQMRKLVCLEGKRPLLEDAWTRDVIFFVVHEWTILSCRCSFKIYAN